MAIAFENLTPYLERRLFDLLGLMRVNDYFACVFGMHED